MLMADISIKIKVKINFPSTQALYWAGKVLTKFLKFEFLSISQLFKHCITIKINKKLSPKEKTFGIWFKDTYIIKQPIRIAIIEAFKEFLKI